MKLLFFILFPFTLLGQDLSIAEMKTYVFEDLNTARADPHFYLESKDFYGKPFTIGKEYTSKPSFVLNDSLSRACQLYADRLAKEGRLEHSRTNVNESIGKGCCYWDIVTGYITEFNSSTDGHRKHLLSLNNSDTQVGIGIAISEDGVMYDVIRTIP